MDLPYRFGRYVLLKKIAQGGMAEIFQAKYLGESGFSKEVCIKRLLPHWLNNATFVQMLIDEAKALVSLSHPNIVQVYELGRDGKVFYISMELVHGIDLGTFFNHVVQKDFLLPTKFVFYLVTEILKALRLAHQKGIVHRDISPQNILLSWEGLVKVTDFGIAKGMHRSLETTQHQVKGKYAYMSPEQARGEKVDARTDLYAAGILLYELLEKRMLFDGINDLATLEQARGARLPSNALQSYPKELRDVVFKALEKEVTLRYRSADEFLKDLHSEATPEEFAKYLGEIFPKEKPEETISKPIEVSKKRFWILRWSLICLLALGLSWNHVLPPKKITEKPALLKVAANPWGEVTIPGIVRSKETPLTDLMLQSGQYQIQIHYPPTNQSVQKVIQLASGARMVCVAQFGENPTVTCR